jgi:hypothetical protein
MQMKLNGGGMRNMTQPTFGGVQVDPRPSAGFFYLKVIAGMLVCGGLLTG